MTDDDRTRVYFTVDVECAEERVIGSGRQPPLGYDLRVWGRFDNRRSELGIGLIMNELEACGMQGTFYTEALGSHFFGHEGLREVCDTMLERGHDVQLHLHPTQREALIKDGVAPDPDNISAYSVDEQTRLLLEGIELLAAAGVPREQLVSFRAGHYGANNDTWLAMKEAGLKLSSSYNPCYFDLNCAMRSRNAKAGLFEAEVDGVWELPITNFLQPDGSFRHMQITAVSLDEMVRCLRQSRAMGVRHISLVSHSFEFFHIDSVPQRRGHVNRINLHRMRGLLRFLRRNEDQFVVETAGELARQLPTPAPDVRDYARPGLVAYIGRLGQQAVQRLDARLPLSHG